MDRPARSPDLNPILEPVGPLRTLCSAKPPTSTDVAAAACLAADGVAANLPGLAEDTGKVRETTVHGLLGKSWRQ